MNTNATAAAPQTATFAAGCFWSVEAAFASVPGVLNAVSGYIGGHTENPTYHHVCTEKTGHAEAVEVTFDPAIVSYEQLLDVFWNIHDPTQVNRQGPDIGTQYRSAIFTHSKSQESAAASSLAAQREKHDEPVVTKIEPATTFYRAEEYHQRYFERHGVACQVPS